MVQTIIGQPIGAGFGKISADEIHDEDASQLASDITNRFIVPVAEKAFGECIDGRMCTETLGLTKPVPGPSVCGGPLITAYAAAEMVGDYFGKTSAASTLERIAEIESIIVDAGMLPGAHVSRAVLEATDKTFIDRDSGRGQTGCGANDEFLSILGHLADSIDAITETTRHLLGDTFNVECMQFARVETLKRNTRTYNPQKVLALVASLADGKNVEILEGEHSEVLVIFNYVPRTTVSRDALVAETGKQVFTVDMWYLDTLAHAMSQGRPDAPRMFNKLKHAMVAFQVSTYITLCDGSHRPVMLQQTQIQDAPALAV